jgi:hypothetical protein
VSDVTVIAAVVVTASLATSGLVLAEAIMVDLEQPEQELGLYWVEMPVAHQEQLQEKASLYWAALLRSDYKAVYDMYPPYARSAISYPAWLIMHGVSEEELETSDYRLVSAVIEAIRRSDRPNFSNLFEVFTRLRIESPDGTLEEGVESNLWELTDDGIWYPSIPLVPSP